MRRSTGDPIQDAANLLMRLGGVEIWPESPVEQRRLLRRARRAVHPDRVGNRGGWDAVEAAAKTIGLEGTDDSR